MRFSRLLCTASVLTPTRPFWRSVIIVLAIVAASLCANAANVNGRIRGVVTDPQDAVIAGAHITATNVATGVKYVTVSGQDGAYYFAQLPVGSYTVTATMQGFATFTATGIVLNIDQEYVQPIRLKVGAITEVMEVSESSVQVDTTDMQFSNVVDSEQMSNLPLIGRNFTGLELTLPGVQAGSDRFGSYSVSGAQSQQSEFLINGADTNDIALNTLVINPILVALSEFNLIDGPLNAEYDRNSGGIVSASIRSGTNQFHGAAFEFYRDTFLNTNNFFQKHVNGTYAAVSPFHQNIVGGAVGGPILKNKLFIFGAFQASPQRTPQGAGSVTVYTSANLGGDFSPDLTGTGPGGTATEFSTNYIPSTISIPGCTSYSASGKGDTWAQCLGTKLNGKVPTSAFNAVTLALVKKYVPAPNNGTTGYAFNETTIQTAYQEDGRVDFNPNSKNQLSFVGIYNFSGTANTIPFSGATVPGFGDGSVVHSQQYSFDYVHQFGPTAVNDFGLHWTRLNFKASFPQQIVQPSSVGFSITPQDKSASTVPQLSVSGFFTVGGTNNGPQPRIDSNYQVEDNFSKVLGHHSLKFGYDGRRFNVWNLFDASNSGAYAFNNTSSPYSTGDPSLDLLLGIPATYYQGTGSILQVDAFLNYAYAQDTWKVSNSLTLNYGLGYSIDTPMRNHQYAGLGLGCLIIGEQSTVFPLSPKDFVFPGDSGCTIAGQATMHYGEFGPRLGFAWTPDLGAISGARGKLSIRAGFGIYYDRTEEESALQTLGTPPFGFTSDGAGDFGGQPSLVNPFVDINGGLATGSTGGAGTASENNRFPYAEPAAGSKVDFSGYEPIYNISSFAPSFRAPYAENYQLSVEREFPSKIVARVSYVGSVARRNQTAFEGNPETAAGHAACVASTTCQTDRNYQAIYFPQNKLANSAAVAEMGLIGSESSSSYNSLQASVTKGQTHGLLFQLSYTYAHAIDNGSNLENTGWGSNGARGYNQYQPSLNHGDSLFDARQRLVFSPSYTVPFRHGGSTFSPFNLLVSGWQISGITAVATGFAYDISYAGTTSRSLYCDAGMSFYACPDVPLQTAALVRGNPRVRNTSGYGTWFGASSFAAEPIGSFGNVHRDPYHGPGINNSNIVVAKNFSLSADGNRSIQIRMESDNAFNHTQFSNPVSQYGSGNFGLITSAAAARQTQLGVTISF
jgi:hypothetical protein